jgi:hypothetical protein
MNWITLTTTDVLAQFNDSETSAYDAAKGDTQSVDLAAIITSVTDQIRHAYRDGGRALDWTTLTSIPPGEKNRAIALVRWKYLLALPAGKALQTGERQQASADAESYFLNVARRKIAHAGAVGVARPGQRVQDFNVLGSTGGGGGW